MPELKASPRNRYLGLLADALSGAKSAADTVQLPVVGGLGSLLFGDAPELVNDVAYYGPQALVRGGNAATGGIGTFTPDRRILDAAGVVPMAPGAARAAKAIANPATYRDAAVAAYGPGVVSPITAWHGSPHKFRKFDNSKMGTGEGAQVYGAGAYLADARPVAEEYRRMLSTKFDAGNLSFDGRTNKVVGTTGNPELDDYLLANLGDFSKTRKNILDDIKYVRQGNPAGAKETQKTLAELRKLKGKTNASETGYLYKADIPDEAVANMLLWDKPLSEQKEVLSQLQKYVDQKTAAAPMKNVLLADEKTQLLNEWLKNPQEKGDIFYSTLMDLAKTGDLSKNQQAASSLLKEAGIPGIRYLDAGSRGQGAGTMNTVVFDDSIIKILERNGVPLGLLAD